MPARALRMAAATGLLAAACGPAAESGRVTFLGCGGKVVTLDIASDSVVADWPVHRAATLGAIESSQWDGCPVEAVAFDARRGVAFLVLPDKARDDIEEPKSYRIVAAQMPEFTPLATLPVPDHARPLLLFDPYTDRLTAQWTGEDSLPPGAAPTGWPLTTWQLEVPSLRVVRRATQRIPNISDGTYSAPTLHEANGFTAASRALPGDRFTDADIVASWVGDTLVAVRHHPTMSVADSAMARRRLQSDTTRFWVRSIDAGERTLLAKVEVRDDTSSTMLVALAPLDAGAALQRLIEVPRGRATLLADERRILVQEVDGSLRRSVSDVKVTGFVRIVDGETGRTVREFKDPSLAGSFEIVRPVCSTPAASKVYMRTRDAGFAILDIGTGAVTARPVLVHPTDRCTFAP